MRKYQQGLLLIITVIIIVAFAWLYNDYSFRSQGGDDTVGVIYDRPIKLGEFQRGLRRTQLAGRLRMFEMLQTLQGRARSEDEAQTNIVFGTYVLRHEADALGLIPTNEEVVEAIKAMPEFHTGGQFDSTKYNNFANTLAQIGFDAAAIEEVVRDDLRFKKIRDLVATTIAPMPDQVRRLFEQGNKKMDLSVVRFNRDEIATGIQVSDEDVKKAFEDGKETLKTSETRKIKFVPFVLNEEQKKLAGQQRGAALQGLLDQAEAFSASLAEPNTKFEDAAQKANLTVAETAEFSQEEPPTEVGGSQEVAEAAFKLTMEAPTSGAVRTQRDGYYVIHLINITPARAMTFEEAKGKLTESLKQERTQEAMAFKTAEIRTKLEAETKAGKSFADAATAAGVKVETIADVSPAKPPKAEVVGGRQIVFAAAGLEAGQLSQVIPTGAGSFLVYVDKVHPIDEAEFDKEKANLVEGIGGQQVEAALPLWFADRMKAANLVTKVGS